MNRTLTGLFDFTLILVVALAIAAPVLPITESNSTETHFDKFSKFAVFQHDNIDDTSETHSHVHKHSEDGEEHDHDHEHSRTFQSNSKFMYTTSNHEIGFLDNESTLGFTIITLISDPHSFGIFRPPIV
jgi:ABC-type Zn2+ transport system substrate-binding protein/surface adhesin